jgi:hypothetical protein
MWLCDHLLIDLATAEHLAKLHVFIAGMTGLWSAYLSGLFSLDTLSNTSPEKRSPLEYLKKLYN